jgi:lipopolysaccharide/colanic/teichoic acid biosynthesis glycosyltransferase
MSFQEMPYTLKLATPAVHGTLRRVFDVTLSAISLISLAPVMLVIAVMIVIEDGGPVFFQQTRLGFDGRPFGMYKFRKFRSDCGTSGVPLTVEGDSRMTRIGRFLAATKLDELPQLWNILKGDMAIVGPRPESMAFADCFQNGYEEILQHKPGLVGPSQVAFRHEAKLYPANEDPCVFYRRVLFPAKAMLDLAYFKRRTIGSDLSLMVQSALTIFNIQPSVTKTSI